MIKKSTRLPLLLGIVTAVMAFTISIPETGPVTFTTTAQANDGGGDSFDRMMKAPTRKIVKKTKRKSAASKRAERKRKAAARKKAKEKAKAAARAKRKAKYRAMTGKQLEKGMPEDKRFGSLKGSMARDIDKARSRKAKAKVARKYSRVFKSRAKQVQGRSVKKANAYRSFAGNLDNYANAQSK